MGFALVARWKMPGWKKVIAAPVAGLGGLTAFSTAVAGLTKETSEVRLSTCAARA